MSCPSVGLSFTMVRARDLYPRKPLVNDSSALVSPSPPFIPLPGEDILYLGLLGEEGVLCALSNYRLFVDSTPRINVPLGLIEALELRELTWIHLLNKDGKTYRFQANSPGTAEEWLRRISSLSLPVNLKLEDVFAFSHAAWHAETGHAETGHAETGHATESPPFSQGSKANRSWFHAEIARLRFDIQGAWRISSVNKDYKLCGTYPEELLIPFCISDVMLEKIAQFRSAQRITAILWRHQITGSVLARCSQPEVGWLSWRSTEDEQMVKALADACAWDRGNVHPLSSSDEEEDPSTLPLPEGSSSQQQQQPNRVKEASTPLEKQKKVLIIDARSYAAAFGNRARGGGMECAEYYPNADIEFMGLANIHYIRKSFHALRTLLNSPCDPSSWFGALDGTKWLTHMSGLMKASVRVTTALEVEGRPVIVHCSDGWDRTSQIVSMSQLLLDPYYRTVDGFRVLVEKEWLDFGHKMADRCGLPSCASDPNERSPIFLQWLDCVHQLLLQFPCSFEFNQSYLVKLAQHTYSSLFGTFLCNNQRERRRNNVAERTRSVWTYLNDNPEQFLNFLYKNVEETLWPKCEVRDLSLWKNVYVSFEARSRFPLESPSSSSSSTGGDSCSADGSEVDGGGGIASESVLVKESSGSCQMNEPDQNGSDSSSSTATTTLSTTNGKGAGGSSSSCSNSTQENRGVMTGRPTVQQQQQHKRMNPSQLRGNFIESSTDTLVPEDSSKNSRLSDGGDTEDCLDEGTSLDADGLFSSRDSVQSRLAEINASHRAQLRALEQELFQTRISLRRLQQKQSSSLLLSQDPSKAAASEEEDEAGGATTTQSGSTTSDISWEAVDEKETKPTLWMPDHAGAVCMGCNSRFWFGRRKHHCRSCGLLFCNNCSAQFSPLPTEQLYSPVRVCDECFSTLNNNSSSSNNNTRPHPHQPSSPLGLNGRQGKQGTTDDEGDDDKAAPPTITVSSSSSCETPNQEEPLSPVSTTSNSKIISSESTSVAVVEQLC